MIKCMKIRKKKMIQREKLKLTIFATLWLKFDGEPDWFPCPWLSTPIKFSSFLIAELDRFLDILFRILCFFEDELMISSWYKCYFLFDLMMLRWICSNFVGVLCVIVFFGIFYALLWTKKFKKMYKIKKFWRFIAD